MFTHQVSDDRFQADSADCEITDCVDYDILAVFSEYFIIHIISATKSQMQWSGIEPTFRCKKMSNNHLSHGNAQKFGGAI
jgi:hypothetical protein